MGGEGGCYKCDSIEEACNIFEQNLTFYLLFGINWFLIVIQLKLSSSDSFKELEARLKLGLKRPDEKVYIVAGASSKMTNFEEKIKQEQEKVTSKENILSELPCVKNAGHP